MQSQDDSLHINLSGGDDGEESRAIRSRPKISLPEMAKQQREHRKSGHLPGARACSHQCVLLTGKN